MDRYQGSSPIPTSVGGIAAGRIGLMPSHMKTYGRSACKLDVVPVSLWSCMVIRIKVIGNCAYYAKHFGGTMSFNLCTTSEAGSVA